MDGGRSDDLNIRPDRTSERTFDKFVRTKFHRKKNIDADHRHARHYQIEGGNKEIDYH
jgi:hypothetical protein